MGNKSDLASSSTVGNEVQGLAQENKRAVTVQEAEEWCRTNNVLRYVETSAKSGEGVERAFLEVAERISENVERGRYDLHDRRSGVRGPGAGGTGKGVRVGMNDVGSGKGGRGWSGGCC